MLSVLCLLAGMIGAVILLKSSSDQETTSEFTVKVNRLVVFMEKNWERLEQGGATAKETMAESIAQDFDYVLLNEDGDVLYQTREGLSVNISQATSRFDLIRDVTADGKAIGKVLIHNGWQDAEARKMQGIAAIFFGMSFILALCMLGYSFYLKKKVIQPFERMKGFAQQVAMGNLDVPLEMDRANVFGAFTQSFDLMREELKASRLREEAALNSRKELIAQLSHDIKTPVASIKAMADVMELSATDAEQKQTIQAINAKADQIDRLVSNLFHATLEELEHLEVNVEELSSGEIQKMIREADHLRLINQSEIPECVVMADPLRLSQVIGNVITNSYKYAGTEINVRGFFEKTGDKDFLTLEISDQGGGVPEEELTQILEKFKRGSNSNGKDGAGLGLYISSYLMNKMDGSLSCKNQNGGFTIVLNLLLA